MFSFTINIQLIVNKNKRLSDFSVIKKTTMDATPFPAYFHKVPTQEGYPLQFLCLEHYSEQVENL